MHIEGERLIPHLFRQESGKIISTLSRYWGIGHLQVAEDIAAETFLKALETWPYQGVPDNPVAQALLQAMGEPIMSTSLILPDGDGQLTDPHDIRLKLGKQVDLIIDSGTCGLEPTTMIDLVEGIPEVIREGKGDAEPFR